MASETKIQWCDHTFNPWRGCAKVSDGCKFCYAEKGSKRNPKVRGTWGPNGDRVVAADSTWLDVPRWDRRAAADGVRRRVFCASLADVFERRPDLAEPRARLFGLIKATPNLDWLLLTKRPENAAELARDAGGLDGGRLPANVWLGASVEDQANAGRRIPALLSAPAAVRFLSCEPLLGPLDLSLWLPSTDGFVGTHDGPVHRDDGAVFPDWVIVGGDALYLADPRRDTDKGGDDFDLWPEDLRVREFPAALAAA